MWSKWLTIFPHIIPFVKSILAHSGSHIGWVVPTALSVKSKMAESKLDSMQIYFIYMRQEDQQTTAKCLKKVCTKIETGGPWATTLNRAPVPNCYHLHLDWHDNSCMLDLKQHNSTTGPMVLYRKNSKNWDT